MEFKDRIKSLRTEKNMTQSQLAAVLGKSEGAIRAWEIERSKPDADTLMILAAYFKCSTDYLLGLSNYRSIDEKGNINTLAEKLADCISRIDSGKGESLLRFLVDFLELVMERNHQFIATSYLVTAQYYYFALDQLYKLQDEFSESKTFDFAKFLDCYMNMSNTATIAKKNMQLMSSYPLPWIMNPAIEYGSDTDEKLVKKFFDAYHNKGLENTTDTWSATMEMLSQGNVGE